MVIKNSDIMRKEKIKSRKKQTLVHKLHHPQRRTGEDSF